ncbi:hypothetical protein T439DRAFT_326737 [Meredithblackwellia eburnea MCA 4105]
MGGTKEERRDLGTTHLKVPHQSRRRASAPQALTANFGLGLDEKSVDTLLNGNPVQLLSTHSHSTTTPDDRLWLQTRVMELSEKNLATATKLAESLKRENKALFRENEALRKLGDSMKREAEALRRRHEMQVREERALAEQENMRRELETLRMEVGLRTELDEVRKELVGLRKEVEECKKGREQVKESEEASAPVMVKARSSMGGTIAKVERPVASQVAPTPSPERGPRPLLGKFSVQRRKS